MTKEYTHEFNILGGTCYVETNEFGKHLLVKFEGKTIADMYGEVFTWQYTGHLHGAALESNQNKQLRQAAEYELFNFLVKSYQE